MALQGSGAIKYSEIQEEFGVAWGKPEDLIWTEIFNNYDGGYYTVYDGFSVSGNWVELPFSWVTLYDGYGSNTGSFVAKETTLTTVFDGYVEGQSYVKLTRDPNNGEDIWTVIYEGVNIGLMPMAFLTIGNRRYSGGSLVVDGGLSYPSFYELKVEDLVTSYVFRHNWEIVGSNADGGVLTSGAFKYTRGEASPATDFTYAIKVEEYKADEVNGTYTYKYELNDVATSTSTSVTSGTYRYSRGDVRFQGVYDDPSPKNRYVIKVENSPTTYVSHYQGVFTVVYNGVTIGLLGNDNYFYVNNRRYSGGTLVVDNGNTFATPNYYTVKIEQSNAKPSFGNYRVSESFGSVTLPLDSDAGANNDTDIPGPGSSIKFSNFYNARLNVAVDYYVTDTTYPEIEYRGDVRERYNLNDKTSAIGGFKGRPEPSGSDSNTGGSKVVVVVDKNIGSVKLDPLTDDMTEQPKKCALRTGSDWSTGTRMRIEVGDNGKIIGAGGNGGNGGGGKGNRGNDGLSGSGALGIEYGTDSNPTIVRVKSSGRIITGYGGGGGGGAAWEGENRPYRSAAGGGGGGGAGLPAGIGGSVDSPTGHTGSNSCKGPDGGNASIPTGGEQGGVGGVGADVTITQDGPKSNDKIRDANGNHIPAGTVVAAGCDQGDQEEAISGAGGNGRDQTIDGTTGRDNGEGVAGMARQSEWAFGVGGDAGDDGGAVRRSTASIKWKFDTDHVVESVFGEGRNVTPLDISESPTGVS